MASKAGTKHKETQKKSKSKEAARSRRGQQNDEFQELSRQLPLPDVISNQLDRLCIMRLTNSYIKIKKLLESIINSDPRQMQKMSLQKTSVYDREALEAMDGFLYVVAPDGQCLYVSDNISHFMGLSQIEVTGNSLYKYVHPCDHEELANQLGGQIPLEDMEIFDGLFCSDSVFMISNSLKKGSKKRDYVNPHRSFFLRMKSTLTNRGKSVNLKASTYRVVHCTGSMKYTTCLDHDGKKEKVPLFLVAIAVPLMFATTFEVPLDRGTFTSRHMLDMKFMQCDEKVTTLLGYSPKDLVGKSWYNFHHAGDLDNVLNTHKLLLTKGQSVSKYYRFLVRDGGWVWIQTKAHVVYETKTCQPQFAFCINYVLGGKQSAMSFLSSEQITPASLASGPKSIITTKDYEIKTEKDDVVLKERNDVIKKEAQADYYNSDELFIPKQDLNHSTCTTDGSLKEEKELDFSEMECKHANYQESEEYFPLDWEDVIQQQELYDKYTWDHYGIQPVIDQQVSQEQVIDQSATPHDIHQSEGFLPLPSTDKSLRHVKEVNSLATEESDMKYRAPFIPPPSTDAGLMCDDDMLGDICLDDPICWLDGNTIQTTYLVPGKTKTTSQSLSTLNSPVSQRKVPESVRRNGYITNDLLNTENFRLPCDAKIETEVDASSCLRGSEHLTTLDIDMLDNNS